MIVGIGLDIVDIARWQRSLGLIADQSFTPDELAACAHRVDRVAALAARFAAKEACLKALNAGIQRGALRQVEVIADPSGAPTIRLIGEMATRARAARVRCAHVSLSHHEGFAAAVVVLEGTRKPSRVPSGTW